MNWNELRDFLRDNLLADDTAGGAGGYYSPDDLDTYLEIASRELAALIGYPTVNIEEQLAAGVGTVELSEAVIRLVRHSVSFEGFTLMPGQYAQVMQYQSYQGLGQPRYYYFERTGGRRLEIGPTPRRVGTLRAQAVETYQPNVSAEAEQPWDGLYSSYHRLIAYRAARMAFEAAPGEEEKAQTMGQREGEILQEFLLHTGIPDIGELSKAGGQ